MSDEPLAEDGKPRVLHYLALGRLAIDKKTGEFAPTKHKILASTFPSKSSASTSTSESADEVKAHLRAIMKRGAEKLTPGKRIRLKSDENSYDVHLLAAEITDESVTPEAVVTLVFFAVTISNYSKYHSVSNVFRDFQAWVFEAATPAQLSQAKSLEKLLGGEGVMKRLMSLYGSSNLRSVESKVDAVKSVMQTSVTKALNQVEKMEDMEDKSDGLKESVQVFQKRAVKVKEIQKNNYRKLGCVIFLVVLALLAYFIIPAAMSSSIKSPGGSGLGTTRPDTSSTGAG